MDRNPVTASPSAESPQARLLFTPVLRGSPRKVSQSWRRSPGRNAARIYLTTPRLKGEVEGSVECTPEVLRQLVSPPPGFPSHDSLDSATRRLDYISETPESLLATLRSYVQSRSGGQFPSEEKDCQTEEDPLREDVDALRAHVKEISRKHAEELRKGSEEYRKKAEKYEQTIAEIRRECAARVASCELQARNAEFVLKKCGLDAKASEVLGETRCWTCESLQERVSALTDQLRASQDYIRKSSLLDCCPLLFQQRGKELRGAVHRQVVLVEERLSQPGVALAEVREEFLRLPYLLKPLFDLIRDYERLLAERKADRMPLAAKDDNRNA